MPECKEILKNTPRVGTMRRSHINMFTKTDFFKLLALVNSKHKNLRD